MFEIELFSLHKPYEWSVECYTDQDYVLVDLPNYSAKYQELADKVNGRFNLGIEKIVRVQNPFVHTRFLLKQEEYTSRNINFEIKELFHDTAQSKVPSIVSSNLDWRLTGRVKYGRGVSFSPSPAYANQESSRNNGTNRAMILTDVLVGLVEDGNEGLTLPVNGGDTTIGNCKNVYVKFFDDEFTSKYIIYYTSAPHVYRRRRW